MGAPQLHEEAAQPQRRRPVAVLVVGAIFLALGCLDVYRAVAPLFGRPGPAHLASDDAMVGLIGIAALVGASFLLAGRNWARWLLAAWMALHVAISVGQPGPLMAHTLLFGVIAFLLFRPRTAAYFRGRAAPGPGH